jgi:hypothetical protein
VKTAIVATLGIAMMVVTEENVNIFGLMRAH